MNGNYRTPNPERYDHAPVNHPAVAQRTFSCVDCGTIILDIEAHDGFHTMLDKVMQLAVSTAGLTGDTADFAMDTAKFAIDAAAQHEGEPQVSRITEPAPTDIPRTKRAPGPRPV